MDDEDLMDLMRAITHLWAGLDALSASLPPDKAPQLAAARAGVSGAMTSILNRHDISTTEAGDEQPGSPAP